jgi:hypothetical protein
VTTELDRERTNCLVRADPLTPQDVLPVELCLCAVVDQVDEAPEAGDGHERQTPSYRRPPEPERRPSLS